MEKQLDEAIEKALREILAMSDEELEALANEPGNDGGIFTFVSEFEEILKKKNIK